MGMSAQWEMVGAAELERVQAMDIDDLMDWLEDGERDTFDAGQAWHGIQVVLSGAAWDSEGLGRVILGGEPFGPELGYGPARWMAPQEVRELAALLTPITVEQFRSQIDFDLLDRLETFPQVWGRAEQREEHTDLLCAGYEVVRSGYIDAAAAGYGLLALLT